MQWILAGGFRSDFKNGKKNNKHKFVQKVAKKIILLIPFVLSVSIRVIEEN